MLARLRLRRYGCSHLCSEACFSERRKNNMAGVFVFVGMCFNVSTKARAAASDQIWTDRQTTRQCNVLFYGDGRNLSFPARVHQYGRCFLKDGSQALSNTFTNYLNCCLFCLPRPAFWVLRQTSEEHFQNKKSSSYRRMHVWLSDTQGTVHCSQAFIPPANHLISAPKKCSARPGSLI